MIPFEFATAPRIIVGRGAAAQVGGLARELGSHALLVTGATPARAEPIRASLAAAGIQLTSLSVAHEPDVPLIRGAVAMVRGARCDVVVGVGGGSVLDTAKAIAALVANDGDPLDYLDVIGGGRALARPSIPCIAMPTTAGTGSEVTKNAVLGAREHRVKVSLRSRFLLPRIAIVDPALAIDLPQSFTATTGLDALTQLIEPYVSCRANPMTDALCADGIPRVAHALRLAYQNGANLDAREQMAIASLYGGMALANAGLGAVHGFAGPIGGMFDAPHGAICAALLPHVMEGNIDALNRRGADPGAVRRYEDVAAMLMGDPGATAMDGVAWVRALVTELKIPPLVAYGVTRDRTEEVVEKASRASSMKSNPIALTPAELAAILARAR